MVAVYRIHSRFLLKYWSLGTFSAISFVALILSSEEFIQLPYINNYGSLFFGAFGISFLLYVVFEIANIRAAATFEERYYYDSEGLYREDNMVAPWSSVRKLVFLKSFTRTKIRSDALADSENRYFTRKPLTRVMQDYHVSEITVMKKECEVQIYRKEGRMHGPALSIDTSCRGFLFNKLYRRLRSFAEPLGVDIVTDEYESPSSAKGKSEAPRETE